MLKIIYNLRPFFEDCYRRINVREYGRIINVSPPTASKILSLYYKEGILRKEKYRNYLFFYANKDSRQFIDLSKVYWSYKLKDLVNFINDKLLSPTIILFGSLAKAEVNKNSDVDLVIFATKKELNLKHFEKKLKRNIQVFWFKSLKDIRNKELANNIINGYVLIGKIKI